MPARLKKALFSAILILVLCFLKIGTSHAANSNRMPTVFMETVPSKISGGVILLSRYVARGIVQAADTPAIQGYVDVSGKATDDTSVFIRAGVSNIDFKDGSDTAAEIDIFTGLVHTIDKLTLTIKPSIYIYPGAADKLQYDFYEMIGIASYDFDILTATATIKYSPDYFGGTGNATYYLLESYFPLFHGFSLNAHIGHQEVEHTFPNWDHWGAGIGYTFQDVRLNIDYTDNNFDKNLCPAKRCDSQLIFGITKSF